MILCVNLSFHQLTGIYKIVYNPLKNIHHESNNFNVAHYIVREYGGKDEIKMQDYQQLILQKK